MEWLDLKDAPRDSTWFLGLTDKDEVIEAHYACNQSGEDQPAFKGFFKSCGSYMAEVTLKGWLPLSKSTSEIKAKLREVLSDNGSFYNSITLYKIAQHIKANYVSKDEYVKQLKSGLYWVKKHDEIVELNQYFVELNEKLKEEIEILKQKNNV